MKSSPWPEKIERRRKYALIAYPFLFAVFLLAVAAGLDFQQFHNDFWDNYFIARHLDWYDRRTWFNPQYPIGYNLFLKAVMGGGLPVAPAIIANVFFTLATLLTCAVFYGRRLGPGLALLALVPLSLFPEFFHYASVGGGDPGAVAFFTLGAMLLFSRLGAPERAGERFLFLSGILLGCAALFRYHALVADGMLILALLIVYPRRWKSLSAAAAGIGAAYAAQWAVNIATGRGLLETQFGPMNVYYLMHGINWYRFTELRLPGSTLSIIAQDPGLFLGQYLRSVLSFYPAYLPPFFAAVLGKDPAARRMARAIALWVLLYFALFSATTSGRQILLPLPLAFLTVGMSLRIAAEKLSGFRAPFGPRRGYPVIALGLALVLAVYAVRDFRMLQRRASQRDAWLSIEAALREGGCVRAREVFSNSFDLYFRSLPHYIPYFNGGAPRWGTYLYNREFPEFPVDSATDFVAACRRRGVRYVVLDPDCRNLSAALGELYEARRGPRGLKLEKEIGEYELYRVEPSPEDGPEGGSAFSGRSGGA